MISFQLLACSSTDTKQLNSEKEAPRTSQNVDAALCKRRSSGTPTIYMIGKLYQRRFEGFGELELWNISKQFPSNPLYIAQKFEELGLILRGSRQRRILKNRKKADSESGSFSFLSIHASLLGIGMMDIVVSSYIIHPTISILLQAHPTKKQTQATHFSDASCWSIQYCRYYDAFTWCDRRNDRVHPKKNLGVKALITLDKCKVTVDIDEVAASFPTCARWAHFTLSWGSGSW